MTGDMKMMHQLLVILSLATTCFGGGGSPPAGCAAVTCLVGYVCKVTNGLAGCVPTECANTDCSQGSICTVKNGNPSCVDKNTAHCINGDFIPNFHCGRGGSRCPDTHSCNIHPSDVFAVCCPKVVKPGTCPARSMQPGICVVQCHNDADCTGAKKCCESGCGLGQCTDPPSTCPPVKPGTFGICIVECATDSECDGGKECCPNACGGGVCTLTCANTKCPNGQLCEMQDVQCIQAPCPPQPVCKALTCANTKCPNGQLCEMQDVQCVQAPCPPQPVCKALTCANKKCPNGQLCEMQDVQCVQAPCPPLPVCKGSTSPISNRATNMVSRWQPISRILCVFTTLLWSGIPLLHTLFRTTILLS